MKILKGFVVGVVEKGTPQKPWAMVGINSISKNRNGFDETSLTEFMVAGQQYKDGLHNAYRQQIGAEVYAPFRDVADNYNGRLSVKYSLQGVPVRLMDVPAQTNKPSAVPEQQKTA